MSIEGGAGESERCGPFVTEQHLVPDPYKC